MSGARRPNRSNKYLGWVWFIATLVAIALLTMISPAEHSLGTHIRVVYLHGAWVWTALTAFLFSGVCGLVGLLARRDAFNRWSVALGKTGLLFWITYLPLSLWAMQSNWNGLFLAEPRWRFALAFAISGLLLQVGLSLANNPLLSSTMNAVFAVILVIALANTPNVMHPASPILSSDAWRIQVYFAGLVLLTFLAAFQVAHWWFRRERDNLKR